MTVRQASAEGCCTEGHRLSHRSTSLCRASTPAVPAEPAGSLSSRSSTSCDQRWLLKRASTQDFAQWAVLHALLLLLHTGTHGECRSHSKQADLPGQVSSAAVAASAALAAGKGKVVTASQTMQAKACPPAMWRLREKQQDTWSSVRGCRLARASKRRARLRACRDPHFWRNTPHPLPTNARHLQLTPQCMSNLFQPPCLFL